ncbi:MAG: hypothetical protein EOP04_33595 [Proteobacteria bacterium]|nr:MAG: hypothetical protein EOP04_33595 [Pseudomonadota bacterium]
MKLPPRYQHLSVTKTAYYTDYEGLQILFFTKWIGKGGDTFGYVVTDGNHLDSYIEPGPIGPQNHRNLALFTSVDPNDLFPEEEKEHDSRMYVYIEKKIADGVYRVLNQDS